ncbi:hypothetical protein FOA52_006577, partial [Chlamydomonas sp. UWO 241]
MACSLVGTAMQVLATADPRTKCALTHRAFRAYSCGRLALHPRPHGDVPLGPGVEDSLGRQPEEWQASTASTAGDTVRGSAEASGRLAPHPETRAAGEAGAASGGTLGNRAAAVETGTAAVEPDGRAAAAGPEVAEAAGAAGAAAGDTLGNRAAAGKVAVAAAAGAARVGAVGTFGAVALEPDVEGSWRGLAEAAGKPPDRPARPTHPRLVPPKQVPSYVVGGPLPLSAHLLHNLAHIELNAIDLAWDTVARFAHLQLPPGFYEDFARVADDESRHLGWCLQRLEELGHAYGDMVAHDLLWEGALMSAHDINARLAVVPLSQEARGLDHGGRLVARLKGAGDTRSAAIVDRIAIE